MQWQSYAAELASHSQVQKTYRSFNDAYKNEIKAGLESRLVSSGTRGYVFVVLTLARLIHANEKPCPMLNPGSPTVF